MLFRLGVLVLVKPLEMPCNNISDKDLEKVHIFYSSCHLLRFLDDDLPHQENQIHKTVSLELNYKKDIDSRYSVHNNHRTFCMHNLHLYNSAIRNNI